MQLKTIILASLATIALGQATTTTTAVAGTSTCAAQNVLDVCVSQTQSQVNSCSPTDYDCLCTAWGVVLTCYNNCPADPNVFSVQQTRNSLCNAASVYNTKTSTSLVTSLVASATSATSLTMTNTHSSSSTGSATASASTHNAAVSLQVRGGVIAVALAGLGLLA